MASTLRILTIMFLFSFLAMGCSAGWKTIRQGTFNGKPYAVQERERSGMFASTNSLDWRIKLGKMSPVPVDATTTDWGLPYSTDIYATDSYLYIDSKDTAYSSVPFTPGTIGVAHTMLYISPSVLNEDEYDTFCAFMNAAWPALSKTLTGNTLRDFPHIIGLVYGTARKYAHEFKGAHDGKKMILRIENDGRVRLMSDDRMQSEIYSGFAGMVQMPGKQLLLDTTRANGGLTMDELRGFKDARGSTAPQVFDIQLSNWYTLVEKGRAITDLLGHKWHATHMQTGSQRQPLEQGEDGSYLWLKSGGIAEEKDGGGVKSADWSYDALTRTVTVHSNSARTIYNLQSITETELVLEQTDASMGTVGLVFRRVD